MWSGPRNISTAMMRSWGSRPDTLVTDEPLYAHYLAHTGRDHPGRDEVIAAYENDPRKVVAWLTGPVPEGRPVWFQKHMTLHLTDAVPRGWLAQVRNAFLVRHPREVLLSYRKVVHDPSPRDLGFPQQTALYEHVRDVVGQDPPVVDAHDVLADPRGTLAALCAALGLPFDERMLRWEPGRRATDGVWAPHWYAAVERSTGFEPPHATDEAVPRELAAVYEECLAHYERMHAVRLRP